MFENKQNKNERNLFFINVSVVLFYCFPRLAVVFCHWYVKNLIREWASSTFYDKNYSDEIRLNQPACNDFNSLPKTLRENLRPLNSFSSIIFLYFIFYRNAPVV